MRRKGPGWLSVFFILGLICLAAAACVYLVRGEGPGALPEGGYDLIGGVTLPEETSVPPGGETPPTEPVFPDGDPAAEPEQAAAPGGYCWRQLDDTEREIYAAIGEAVEAGGVSFTMEAADGAAYQARVMRAVSAFVTDHPQYFWLQEGYHAEYRAGGGGEPGQLKVELQCYGFWAYTVDPQKYLDALRGRVQEIVNEAAALPTDYEKAVFVHDYVVTHTEYDYDAQAEARKTYHDAAADYVFTAYGCLVNGRAVCAGYAKACQLLLDALDVECVYVRGTVNGGRHAWNCVLLGGDYYHSDPTWDDLGLSDGLPNEASHTYCNVTAAEISLTHTLDEEAFRAPVCTAERYNYFTLHGAVLASADEGELIRLLNAAPGDRLLELRYTPAGAALAEKAAADDAELTGAARLCAWGAYRAQLDRKNRVLRFVPG